MAVGNFIPAAMLAGIKKKAEDNEEKAKVANSKNANKTTSKSGGNSSVGTIGESTGGATTKNNQFTGSSNGVVVNNSTQQSIKDKMNENSIAWWQADEAGRKALEAENQSLAAILGGSVSFNPDAGTWSGTAGGYEVTTPNAIMSWNDNYNKSNPKASYKGKWDAQMEATLKEILNREDFSYDAMNDPLYQQLAQMYRREGDRAMRETLAEAAAGAGGMNTYAITAAQQANNYYNSQLNDKIPELFQLAYEMYLTDKESKVQDLGLLQAMDDKTYGRYRDNMNDWYNDKNFAYGVYQDAVQQGNWQTNFDYNAMINDRDFMYSDMWNNKEWDYTVGRDNIADNRYDQQWNAEQSQLELENSRYDREQAQAEVWKWISMGIKPSADLIARSGMDEATINLAIEMAKAEQTGGSYTQKGNDYIPGDDGEDDGPKGKIPQQEIAGIMTEQEWNSRKSSYEMSGQGGVAVSEYDTYEEYRRAMMDYLTVKYS